MSRASRILPAVASLLVATPASAQTVFGYQLGVVQSAGGTFGDPVNPLLVQQGQDGEENLPADNVQQVQGVQLNTTVTANVTLDAVTDLINHGLVLGAAYTQLLPFAVPEDAQATLRERQSTFNATAQYLARVQEAQWGLQFGAGYVFSLNGRLPTAATGQVGQAADATTPATSFGLFALNAQAHTFNAQLQHTLNRARWDLLSGVGYTYAVNGLFTLAAGGVGAQNQAAQNGQIGVGTNLGGFILQNAHTITPQVEYRRRVNARNTLTLRANAAATITVAPEDRVIVEGINTTPIAAQIALPPTLVNNAEALWTYNANNERQFGGAVSGTFGLRVPVDGNFNAIPGASLGPDTVIWTARGFYQDLLPLETRITLGVGVAQATLIQPPIGAPGDPATFEPVRSNLTPLADATLRRRFEPVDVALAVGRAVGVGAFGASAVVTDTAALTFTHVTEWEMPLTTTVGFNAQRTQAVGQDLFRGVDPRDPVVAAFNNQGFGAIANIAYPIFREDPFAFDLNASYSFTYNDLDPTDAQGLEPIRQHLALLAIRGTFGRGAAQQAVGAGGRRDTDELDAFSANPRDGSPLITQRLLGQGAPVLQRGERPGLPPREAGRRDSRQQYQQSLRQEQLEQEARDRSTAVQGIGSYYEEEQRRLEAERDKQEEAAEQRDRDAFSNWPTDSVALPEDAPPPPPPAETKEEEKKQEPSPPPPRRRRRRRR
ncbi:MAG: hypothetical protein RIT81_15500 [Deltaproteobacteria bacterium]